MSDIYSETIKSFMVDEEGSRSGALLTRPLYAVAEVRITKNADPGSIKLLLDYDARNRLQGKK
jgi:hypothetical protein